ncbi:hypothetical protein EON63_01790 [archaeon]|nr:MAG: hypothetical protein EON63_01790 [archaeon]
MGALEEDTGDPVVLERSEVFYLYITGSMCNDPLYNELRFNMDDKPPELTIDTEAEKDGQREEEEDVLSTSPQPPHSPHSPSSHHPYNINRVNTSEKSAMNSSLMSVYSSNYIAPSHHPRSNPSIPTPSAPSPFGRSGAVGGKVDQVKEMSLLLHGLKRQATLKQKEIHSSEGGPGVGVVGKLVGGAEDAVLKETVKEFKRVTLAEMGFVLPHQYSYMRPVMHDEGGVYKSLSKNDNEI